MQTIEQQLRGRLAELLGREARIEHDRRQVDSALPADWEEQAVSLENSEVLAALDHHTREEISRIMEALGRMKMGTYGLCVACGEQIPIGRLHILPFAPRCRSCAEQA